MHSNRPDLGWVHKDLAPYYSHAGRPSIDPELMIRMLIVGYVFAIRSQRMICREVQVNLAYPLVLQAWDRGQDPRSFCVLTRQARALPRQQCPRRVFERGGGDMHRGGPRRHVYICPAGAGLTHAGVVDQAHPYRASKSSAPRHVPSLQVWRRRPVRRCCRCVDAAPARGAKYRGRAKNHTGPRDRGPAGFATRSGAKPQFA